MNQRKKWSMMSRRTSLLVWLPVAVGSLIMASVVGMMFLDISWNQSKPPRSTTVTGVHIEELKSAEELFALARQDALILKYWGGDLEFWIELESDGKEEKFGEKLNLRLGRLKPAGPDQTIEGYFIWLRGESTQSGTEPWTVAMSRTIVSEKASGLEVKTPSVRGNVSTSDQQEHSVSAWHKAEVQVSTGKQQWLEGSETSGISNPLSPNQEVCIKELNQEQLDSENRITGSQIMRLMCKIVPQGAQVANGDHAQIEMQLGQEPKLGQVVGKPSEGSTNVDLENIRPSTTVVPSRLHARPEENGLLDLRPGGLRFDKHRSTAVGQFTIRQFE